MPKRTTQRLTKTAIERAAAGAFVWDSEVPGFGVRTTSAGARSYILQYRARDGGQRRCTIGSFPAMTVDQARAVAREMRVLVEKGGDPARDRQAAREAPTIADLSSYYCGDYAAQENLRPSTVSGAKRALQRYVLPRFGNRKVAKITAADVRWMRSDAHKTSGVAEANRLKAILSRMFNLAIERGWREDNPCRGIKNFHEEQRWTYLNDEEVAALLEACDAYEDQNAANAVRLLLFTGARLQEVLKADWSQFDLPNGIWCKPSSHTKQKRTHRLFLDNHTLELLRRMRDERPDLCWLFPGRDEVKPRADLNRPWKRLLAAAGLPHYRLHDLRRTTASFMLSTGSDLSTVGQNLGHTQASTTLRYARLFPKQQQEGITRAVERMRGLAA